VAGDKSTAYVLVVGSEIRRQEKHPAGAYLREDKPFMGYEEFAAAIRART